MPLLKNPAFYVFLATLGALVLLVLTAIPTPVFSQLAFLHATQADGVKFGMWGWCLNNGEKCSPSQFGYAWPPEINGSITKSFVFYPIAIGLTFFAAAAGGVLMLRRSARVDAVFNALAWAAFGTSALAFLFMIGICGVAKSRFEKRGYGAKFGSLTWISLSATVLLFIVSLCPYYLPAPPKTKGGRPQMSDVESRRTVRRWAKGSVKLED